ncbi:MAG TPA: zinc transporter ZupT [Armatimonadota bacterium]|nr:zinc transporter ZupT [Armatimonadota bacterium]HOM70885.1 zinc transporter ZupT [Armatimonadota bacterium]HPP74615.1 zinc transporter ZupT [Armatimonadota bacterium]
MDNSILIALGLSVAAGLSTTVGGFVTFLVRNPTHRFLSITLGFSAGVMVAVSFVELYASAILATSLLGASLAFFVGFALMFIIDVLVPHSHPAEGETQQKGVLLKVGGFTALGLALHNFPEGFAVFAGTLQSAEVGILLAIAIAIHNIPEGIAVAVPIYYATGSKKKALMYSFISGIVEPVGALLAALVLLPLLNPAVVSYSLAGVAGVMVFISLDELLPAAHHYGQEHATTVGVMSGMIVMIATLVLLNI